MWFKAVVPGGHVGSGKQREKIIYVFAKDAAEAYRILRIKTSGWKKAKNVSSIKKLSSNDARELEETIKRYPSITLAKIKKDRFFYV